MKKLFLVILVFALSLSLTKFALAASTTVPPSSVCLIDNSGYTYPLVIKLAGTVKMSGKFVKFYNVNGAYYLNSASVPLVGAGDVKGTEFHFSCTGSSYWESALWTIFVEGFWDLADKTNPVGTVTWRQITDTGENLIKSDTLSLTSCSTAVLPY